jgi:hypothetical protein
MRRRRKWTRRTKTRRPELMTRGPLRKTHPRRRRRPNNRRTHAHSRRSRCECRAQSGRRRMRRLLSCRRRRFGRRGKLYVLLDHLTRRRHWNVFRHRPRCGRFGGSRGWGFATTTGARTRRRFHGRRRTGNACGGSLGATSTAAASRAATPGRLLRRAGTVTTGIGRRTASGVGSIHGWIVVAGNTGQTRAWALGRKISVNGTPVCCGRCCLSFLWKSRRCVSDCWPEPCDLRVVTCRETGPDL